MDGGACAPGLSVPHSGRVPSPSPPRSTHSTAPEGPAELSSADHPRASSGPAESGVWSRAGDLQGFLCAWPSGRRSLGLGHWGGAQASGSLPKAWADSPIMWPLVGRGAAVLGRDVSLYVLAGSWPWLPDPGKQVLLRTGLSGRVLGACLSPHIRAPAMLGSPLQGHMSPWTSVGPHSKGLPADERGRA